MITADLMEFAMKQLLSAFSCNAANSFGVGL